MDANALDNMNAADNTTAARALFVMRVGARLFAVHADEVEATATHLTPTPLPFAPPAVRGVVSLHGRARTVLDPLRLFDADASTSAPDAHTRNAAGASGSHASDQTSGSHASDQSSVSQMSDQTFDSPVFDQTSDSQAPEQTSPRLFVALRGDEQLALVCDAGEEMLEVPPALIELRGDASPARGTFDHHGRAVTLLDPARLFDAAMRGTERRRKRS
jgi:chemotaxis signal transduction protein